MFLLSFVRYARIVLRIALFGQAVARRLGAVPRDWLERSYEFAAHDSMERGMFGMCAVFAQLEADLIRVRTMQGLDEARRKGKTLGRPSKLDSDMVRRAHRMRASGKSLRHIASVLECSPTTIRKAVA